MPISHEMEMQLIRAENLCYKALQLSNQYISEAMSKMPCPRGNTLVRANPYYGFELTIKAGKRRIRKNKKTGEVTEDQSLDLIISPVGKWQQKGYWLRLISNTLFGDTFHVFHNGEYKGSMDELGLKPQQGQNSLLA